MDGIHDLGGMDGFGSIGHEADATVFHEPWQATTFGLLLASIGQLRNHTADAYRHSVERMAPAHYLQAHYYERMLTGTLTLLVEKGVLDLDELEARAGGVVPLAMPVAEQPLADLDPQPVARFVVGERVRVLDFHPAGHTRAPRYCRGKQGVVLHVAPPFAFPDTAAHDGPFRKEHTYHVEFAATDLWPDAAAQDSVVVDLWDSYLEPATP